MYLEQSSIIEKFYDASSRLAKSTLDIAKFSKNKFDRTIRTAGQKTFNAYAKFGESLENNNGNVVFPYLCLMLGESLFAWTTLTTTYLGLPPTTQRISGIALAATIISSVPARWAYKIKWSKENSE